MDTACRIPDWDVDACWLWADWPDRTQHFPGTTRQDIGIDLVARRSSDGGLIAIQCKARQLEADGTGSAVHMDEVTNFATPASSSVFSERWLVTNGAISITANAQNALDVSDRPVKLVSLAADLAAAIGEGSGKDPEYCPHCDDPEAKQTRTCMQREAVESSVRTLREHAATDSGGLPKDQARGRIILPCGSGKTRVALRIVEQLTAGGELSVVLCPSIALVAQLRREFLQNAEADIRTMAVCSDQTAGYDPKKEGNATDPTRDSSNTRDTEIKGLVTTDPNKIAEWITKGYDGPRINVIFGTYQSASRVSEAIEEAGAAIQVLVCDEAHRTAALRRQPKTDEQERLREFTLCHDQQAFPARYRVYQTATPRIYNFTASSKKADESDFIVRSMDDETVFGVELYRKSYVEGVRNGWLSDYRIIALGVNSPEVYDKANELARAAETTSTKNRLTTTDYLRGLALSLAMAGATRDGGEHDVAIRSCIAFMNTVNKSKSVVQDLQSEAVREWLASRVDEADATDFTLEHLDATHNVVVRDNAKRRLSEADERSPHGVVNVGIFGEGTDSPSLSAVAFLEPRKSPIDVVQAVGRAMRTTPGKKYGYIICPILIPPNADPEEWLKRSKPDEGWSELGQILLALRAHDNRIEDELPQMLQIRYVPKQPEMEFETATLVAVATPASSRIRYGEYRGPEGSVADVLEKAAHSDGPLSRHGISPVKPEDWTEGTEPSSIMVAVRSTDGSVSLRHDTVERDKPTGGCARGRADADKTKKHARNMINKGKGVLVPAKPEREKRTRKTAEQRREERAQLMFENLGELSSEITVNLLSRSGLRHDRVRRDLNILEDSVREAAFHLREDGTGPALDGHFGLDHLDSAKGSDRADGCTIAALLMMNAAMLHQRIASGGWLRGVEPIAVVKNSTDPVRDLRQNWERITRHDFLPVIEPALEAVYAVEDTGRLAGLERALRHLASEAERIAETYADMGADHAGPLFNKVMGNQASDGAYFTRPPAATMAARLTLDACDDGSLDWTSADTWRNHRSVDLACGSGTLLAALLSEMKRRASEQGATRDELAELQKIAVEEVLKGMDINPVSLQMAATQLTAGNTDIRYRRMGLYQMPYGPTGDDTVPVAAGTLELLDEPTVLPRQQPQLVDRNTTQEAIQMQRSGTIRPSDPDVQDAAEAAMSARIAIMNPPFTERTRMGQKFPKATQARLRQRVDGLEATLVAADPELGGFVTKRSLRPVFVALADRCVADTDGVLSMILPTIALANHSGALERHLLANRFAVDTVLTCHQPGNTSLSQNSGINESIITLRRCDSEPPPAKFIALDRFPNDDADVAELFASIAERDVGVLADGWGEVSEWPADRVSQGDWTAAIWRSPILAEEAAQFVEDPALRPLRESGASCHLTRPSLAVAHRRASEGTSGAFPILKTKGADGQLRISATPDEHWIHKEGGPSPVLDKAGHLLVTAGQNTSTGRLTAVASGTPYVGHGWMPVVGISAKMAQAAAVFLNSTAGRLLLMRSPGRMLGFPNYTPATFNSLPVPDLSDLGICATLADCWIATRRMPVPQFRDGECEVRQVWDAEVCDALSWDEAEISALRKLLHQEPHVRGLGYGQFSD